MTPGINKTKYKYLPRIRINVFNNLKTKTFKNKKWRQVVRAAKYKKAIPLLATHTKRPLSRFPNNLRYYYKNTIHIKLGFQLYYGRIQDYKLKAIIRHSLKAGLRNAETHIYRDFEYRLESILFNLNIVNSVDEGRHHLRYKRVFVNKSLTKKKIIPGDVLHFSNNIRRLAERRMFKKPKKVIPFELDLEPSTLRILIIINKKVFSHPFLYMFRRLSKWYAV